MPESVARSYLGSDNTNLGCNDILVRHDYDGRTE